MQKPFKQLLNECMEGDSSAWSELFERYRTLVYRTAFLILGNPEDAEDSLQEVFVQVFRYIHNYDPHRGAFATWLYKITVNCCLSKKRRAKQLQTVPLDDVEVESLSANPLEDPFKLLMVNEQTKCLLEALDEDQRVVVILRFYWELPYQEIAEITSTALGTVQSRLGRAMKKMRVVMSKLSREIS